MHNILVIDDEIDLLDILKDVLGELYTVFAASNLKLAKSILQDQNIELILLDLNLPDGSGFEFCTYVKSNPATEAIPVLIVSGSDEVSAKVAGFELGAEDFISKPFQREELFARVKSKLKHSTKKRQSSEEQQIGPYLIDQKRLKIYITHSPKTEIDLSPMEFKLLSHLMLNDGKVFTRDQLINICSGDGYSVTDRSIDTHIYSLRKKIDEETSSITTHYGTGYSFDLKS